MPEKRDVKWYYDRCISGTVTWGHVVSELKELISARSILEIIEEWNDVWATFIEFVYTNYGISVPILNGFGKSSFIKYYNRIEKWEEIFKSNNLKFDKKYLINGGNYQRPEKVRLALEMARDN